MKKIGMILFLILASFLFVLFIRGMDKVFGDMHMPAEHKEERIDAYIDTAGLLHFCYDTDKDGKKDFEVVRRQTIFIVSPDNTITIAEKPFWERYPFIYYYDISGDGEYQKDEMFLDRESDGINGNEVYLEGGGKVE